MEHKPYIPPGRNLPEITGKALVLGILLAIVLGGANAYLGLKVGMTVSASIPAAVISMAILRFFRESNILENNIVQTAASAGESLAAGAIFTLPALIILHYWQGFPLVDTMAVAAFGGMLGVLFTIPLRRALILQSELAFPEGVATAEVLKAGDRGGRGIIDIAMAAVAAGLAKLAQTGFKIFSGTASTAFSVRGAIFGIGSELSPALLAVGYIVGLNIATVVFVGGLISWLLGIPVYSALYGYPEAGTLYDAALEIWSSKIRYMGVGAMVVGGIWALVALYRPIREGIQTAMAAVRKSREEGYSEIPRTERDIPFHYVMVSTLLLALPLFFVFMHVINPEHLQVPAVTYWLTIVFAVLFALFAGFLFASVAGYMAGLVGSSNNPISGVTIATILAASLILLVILGSQIDLRVDPERATAAAATAILIGAVVACAAAIAGDNLQDLKAGWLVGATPYKQQIMQMVGTLSAAVVIAPILDLLFNAYGLGGVFPRPGMDPGEMLSAPQATLMASVAQGVFARNLEWGMVGIGALIAVGIILIDEWLKARKSTFRIPVLAVAVGIYLPLELTTPIFIGGLVAYLAGRALCRKQCDAPNLASLRERASRRGLLFSSGLITGEALVGIMLAIPFALYESTDVLRIAPESFKPVADVLGIFILMFFVLWLYRIAQIPREDV